jgi:hypothetical protein
MNEPARGEERQPFVSKILVVGLLACVSLIAMAIAFAPPDKRQSPRVACVTNLRVLGAGLLAYADEHDGKYPPAESWCDLLVDAFVLKENFRCPAGDKKSRCD